MTRALIALVAAGTIVSLRAQDIGADDLIGAGQASPEGELAESASTPAIADDSVEDGALESGGNSREADSEAAESSGEGRGGEPESTLETRRDVDNFVAFVYSPGPRDPFISPNSPSRIVLEVSGGKDITLESLMAFAEKLKGDLGERIRVVGVSVAPTGAKPYALVIYASGKASKGGGNVVEALPPRTVSVESGLPVRYPEEETLFISKLAQLVAQSSPIRLKRDSRVGAVIFPIQTIDDRGVLVSLPGYDEPILLPVYRDVDTRTESDN